MSQQELRIIILTLLAISVVLFIVSTLICRRSPKDEYGDPSSRVFKTIYKLFFLFFVLFIVFLFIWLLPLIIGMKSFFK